MVILQKKSTIRMVLALAGLVIMKSVVYAAPSVSTVNGTITHGTAVTVSGSGFGVKSPVAPLKWDPVDGVYTNITENGNVPQGSSYMWNGSATGQGAVPTFTLTNPRGKFKAKYSNKTRLSGDGWSAVGGNNFPAAAGKKLYVSWWIWADGSMCTSSSSNKLYRFTDNGDWSSSVRTVIWEPDKLSIYGIDTGYVGNEWISTCGTPNSWARMESVIDNTTNPKPRVNLFVNNATRGPSPIPMTKSLSADITGIYSLGADWTNTPGGEPRTDYGEIYVDNTLARVEICNASTKASSNHCEIQIPQNTWSDGQLEIKVNQGSFTDNSSAYLYVIDSSGSVSNGKQVTFGSGGSTSLAAPSVSVSSVTK